MTRSARGCDPLPHDSLIHVKREIRSPEILGPFWSTATTNMPIAARCSEPTGAFAPNRMPSFAGINVVRPVGRSTLTPAAVRRACTHEGRGGKHEQRANAFTLDTARPRE